MKASLPGRLRRVASDPKLLKPALQRRLQRASQRASRNLSDLSNVLLRRPDELRRLEVVWTAPTEMTIDERLMLYSLVRGRQPAAALEIGTSKGGSGVIIATAMEANGVGEVVTVDPIPSIEVEPRLFYGRLRSLARPSPEGIAEARAIAGRDFDLILIDGIHIHRQAEKDLAACLPYAAEGAHVLLHDSFHLGVREAIEEAVERHPELHDCGYVCSRPRPVGDLLTHGGFRLLRWGSSAVVDPMPMLSSAYAATGQPPPSDPGLRNHDFWYCEAVEPCDYCIRVRQLEPPPANQVARDVAESGARARS